MKRSASLTREKTGWRSATRARRGVRATQRRCAEGPVVQLSGAALPQKRVSEPSRHVKREVSVCKAGAHTLSSQTFDPLLLFPCSAEQPDRLMGPSRLASGRRRRGPDWPRLAQASLWILIIHQDSGLAFTPLSFAPVKTHQKYFKCVCLQECGFVCVCVCEFVWVGSHTPT